MIILISRTHIITILMLWKYFHSILIINKETPFNRVLKVVNEKVIPLWTKIANYFKKIRWHSFLLNQNKIETNFRRLFDNRKHLIPIWGIIKIIIWFNKKIKRNPIQIFQLKILTSHKKNPNSKTFLLSKINFKMRGNSYLIFLRKLSLYEKKIN